MLLCFMILVALLFDTVIADVCIFKEFSPTSIEISTQDHDLQDYDYCQYYIESKDNRSDGFILTFTEISGFDSTPVDSQTYTSTHSKSDRIFSTVATKMATSPKSEDSAKMATSAESAKMATSSKNADSAGCLPSLDITEINNNGVETNLGIICKKYKNYDSPQVFQGSSYRVRVTYHWIPDHFSSFRLTINFKSKEGQCGYRCGSGECLSDAYKQCDGFADCSDRSDEEDCSAVNGANLSSKGTSNPEKYDGSVSFLQIIVIVTAVVVAVAVMLCLFKHCYWSGSPQWHSNHHNHHHLENGRHQCHQDDLQPLNSEVVYVPSRSHREGRGPHQHSHQVRLQGVQTDPVIDMPPHIAISWDGEEGYISSQRMLQMSNNDASREDSHSDSVRPPPNKTVFDRESPPPYRARSQSMLDSSRQTDFKPGRTRHFPQRTACPNMGHSRSSSGSSNHSNQTIDPPPDYSYSQALYGGTGKSMDSYNNNRHSDGGV
ncbi:unnamed protein product [Owenia fusiformis]|uniref:CUB domain-containing protein n=1 Tax=Owenia fusiformis TaxID=6347 RepID=A0A8S4NHP0_OWEFU|nr:unnamed protein product [Owenia fusiformis]